MEWNNVRSGMKPGPFQTNPWIMPQDENTAAIRHQVAAAQPVTVDDPGQDGAEEDRGQDEPLSQGPASRR